MSSDDSHAPLRSSTLFALYVRRLVQTSSFPPYKDAAMPPGTPSLPRDTPLEHLACSVERVTFHSEETGFCVLRVKVRGHRELVTVVVTAPIITPAGALGLD